MRSWGRHTLILNYLAPVRVQMMLMKSKTVAICFCMVGLLGGVFAKLWLEAPGDQDLIRDALRQATRNGKEGKPGGVLDYLSAGFKVGDFEPTSGDISEFVRRQRPEITVLEPNPVIRGDLAEITSPVEIKYGIGNIGATRRVEGVRVIMRREAGLRYGIFPTPRWRIVSVEPPPGSLIQ